METTFQKELENLINRYGQENGSDTPDFILAQYLHGCLRAFNIAVVDRENWYGRRPIGVVSEEVSIETLNCSPNKG